MLNEGIRRSQLLAAYRTCQVKPDAMARATAIVVEINGSPRFEEYRAAASTLGSGIPPWFIGCLHYRESDLNLKTYLGNGELIIGTGRKTTLVPKLRGPFATFHDGAIDALTLQFKGLGDWQDTGNLLVRAEQWNGMGYARMGVVSPYLFSGTDLYHMGKFGSDGHYDSGLIDQQLGVTTLMKVLKII